MNFDVSPFFGMSLPKCPYCGKELATIHWDEYDSYEFKDGRYEFVEGEAVLKCPECEEELPIYDERGEFGQLGKRLRELGVNI